MWRIVGLALTLLLGCPEKESAAVQVEAAAPIVSVTPPPPIKPALTESAPVLPDATHALRGIAKLRALVTQRRAHIHIETEDACTAQQTRASVPLAQADEDIGDVRMSRESRYANAAPNLGLRNATPVVDCLTLCAIHIEDVPDQESIDALRDDCDKAIVILDDLERDVRAGK